MKPLISVVIPIYNVEKYLERSLNSILNQTMTDIEIILINDGSTDGSYEICKRYSIKDTRIKLIDQENQGVSEARNVGIINSSGKYITFVDPDDWIELDMFEKLCNSIILYNSDFSMCNYIIEAPKRKYVNLPTNQITLIKKDITELLIPNLIGSDHLFNQENVIMGSVCRVLFKKSIITNNNIKFDRDVKLMEDLLFCLEYFMNSLKGSIVHDYLYHYEQNKESAVNSYRSFRLSEMLLVYRLINNLLAKTNLSESVSERMDIRYIRSFMLAIKNEFNYNNSNTNFEVLHKIRTFCRDPKLNTIIRRINKRKYSFKQRLRIALLEKKMYLLIFVLNKINSKR